MYREPSQAPKYVIDERPIIKREIKLPKINMPVWLPGTACLIASPMLCGLAWSYLTSGLCVGAIVSFGLFGITGAIHAIGKASSD